MPETEQIKREHYVDWLRIAIIFLLFPFHTARIFDYWEANYVKNPGLSWGLSWLIVIIGYWFMALMFWLAGSASWHALEVRGGREYIKERISRLFIPLIFGILIIVPPQAYLAKLSQAGYSKSYLQFLPTYFTDYSDLSGYFGTFTPAHLWFILYLLIISLACLPLMLWFKGERGRKVLERIRSTFSTPWKYLLLFVPLTATEALPDIGGKNLFFYCFLFLAGYVTAADGWFILMVRGIKGKLAFALLPVLALFLVMTGRFSGAADWAPESVLLAFVRNLTLWLTIMVILGYGEKYLNFSNKWLGYLNQAVFPVYVIHQTVLLIIGYYIVHTGLNLWLKFVVITVLSLLACWAAFDRLIRRWGITRWLFGVKARRPASASKPVDRLTADS